MYRTATVAIYDVMDQVMVAVNITEYPSTPGEALPDRIVLSGQYPSVGAETAQEWARRALSDFVADHM